MEEASFSSPIRSKDLEDSLYYLRSVCYPPIEEIKKDLSPMVIVRRGDFRKYTKDPRSLSFSYLKKCTEYCAKMETDELEKLLTDFTNNPSFYIDKKGFGKKWVFCLHRRSTSLYLEKGTCEVVFNLPAYMLFKIDCIHDIIGNISEKCMKGKEITKESEDYFKKLGDRFPDTVYRNIFNNFLSPEVRLAGLIMYEALRSEILNYLEKHEVQNIMKTEEMKDYLAEHKDSSNVKDLQNVHDFLKGKGHENFTFRYAEKIGLIMHSELLISQYKDVRNNVRHPDKSINKKITPQKIYEDFCAILGQEPDYLSIRNMGDTFKECFILKTQMDLFRKLVERLDPFVDPEHKKGDKSEIPDGWIDNLVEKGLMSKKQAVIFNNLRHRTGAIAHHNVKNWRKLPNFPKDQYVLLKELRERQVREHFVFEELYYNLNEKIDNMPIKSCSEGISKDKGISKDISIPLLNSLLKEMWH